MVLGVDEVLGVVNDLHRRAAVHGEADAVLGRNGILQNLLRAVGMDEDRHGAGLRVGNGDLHLGLARVLGQFHLDGGGGAGIAGSLHLNGSFDGLAVLLGVLNGLVAQGSFRLGLAVLVGFHRAGGAVGGLIFGDGAAVLLGLSLGDAAVLAGGGRHHGAVRLRLDLGDGAVGVRDGVGLDGGNGGGRTAATAAGGGTAAGGAAAGRRDRRGLRVQHNGANRSLIVVGIIGNEYPLVFLVGHDHGGIAQLSAGFLVHPLDRTSRPACGTRQFRVLQRLVRGGDLGVNRLAGGLRLIYMYGNALLRCVVVTAAALDLVINGIFTRICCRGDILAVLASCTQTVQHGAAFLDGAPGDERLSLTVVGQGFGLGRSVFRVFWGGGDGLDVDGQGDVLVVLRGDLDRHGADLVANIGAIRSLDGQGQLAGVLIHRCCVFFVIVAQIDRAERIALDLAEAALGRFRQQLAQIERICIRFIVHDIQVVGNRLPRRGGLGDYSIRHDIRGRPIVEGVIGILQRYGDFSTVGADIHVVADIASGNCEVLTLLQSHSADAVDFCFALKCNAILRKASCRQSVRAVVGLCDRESGARHRRADGVLLDGPLLLHAARVFARAGDLQGVVLGIGAAVAGNGVVLVLLQFRTVTGHLDSRCKLRTAVHKSIFICNFNRCFRAVQTRSRLGFQLQLRILTVGHNLIAVIVALEVA